MALDSAAGLFGMRRSLAPEGDRSVRAKFAILVLAAFLAATVLFSLASGASDASAFAVVRDWLFPSFSATDALSLRDRVIVYDIRLPIRRRGRDRRAWARSPSSCSGRRCLRR